MRAFRGFSASFREKQPGNLRATRLKGFLKEVERKEGLEGDDPSFSHIPAEPLWLLPIRSLAW